MPGIEQYPYDIDWDGKRADQRSFVIVQMPIERNFLQVMGMQLVERSGFTGSPADSANFILNETAIKATGIKEPVIGKRLTFQGIKGVIAGVVKEPISPPRKNDTTAFYQAEARGRPSNRR